MVSWKQGAPKVSYILCFCGSFGATWSIPDAHLILKGVPQIDIFEKNWKNKKKEVQETALKNMILGSIFDAKMRGLKL